MRSSSPRSRIWKDHVRGKEWKKPDDKRLSCLPFARELLKWTRKCHRLQRDDPIHNRDLYEQARLQNLLIAHKHNLEGTPHARAHTQDSKVN